MAADGEKQTAVDSEGASAPRAEPEYDRRDPETTASTHARRQPL